MELRPGYRQTEIGVIPSDWDVRPLGDLFVFKNGVNAEKACYGAGIRFVNVLEPITYSHLSELEIPGRVSLPEAVAASYVVRRGDVLFNRTSETDSEIGLAAAYLGSEPVAFGGFVIRGRPIDDCLDPIYTGYALRAPIVRAQIIPMGQGAIRSNIGQQNLARVRAPLPSPSEQCVIAKALSDVDALLDSLDRVIAKKRDIKQAAMQQLLTGRTRLPGFDGEWGTKQLGELCSLKSGESITAESIDEYSEFPCYGGNGLRGHTRRFTHEGDHALIGRQGALCGNVVCVSGKFFASEHALVVTPKPGTDIHWLASVLKRENLNQYSESSAQPGLSASKLLLLEFRVPTTRDEQAAIATVLSDMDAELATLVTRRAKTRDLKEAMMQELLTGRIRLMQPQRKAEGEEKRGARKANIHFQRSVLAAEIVDQLHLEPTFGHVKLEKLIFLAEHLCRIDTGSTYHRDAAGPYDNRALRSIDSQLKKQQWFEARKIEGRYQYAPLAKRGGHKKYFDSYFQSARAVFDRIIDTFRTLKTERCEIVATLLSAWVDLIRQGQTVTDDAIVHEVLTNWHESKTRIPEDRWRTALAWMRESDFVPVEAVALAPPERIAS